jgi:hypothetical protein
MTTRASPVQVTLSTVMIDTSSTSIAKKIDDTTGDLSPK